MSDKPYLTNDEIFEIVEPLTQRAAIVRWFRKRGYHVTPRPSGMPLVNREAFNEISRGVSLPTKKPAGPATPDRAALISLFGGKRGQKA